MVLDTLRVANIHRLPVDIDAIFDAYGWQLYTYKQAFGLSLPFLDLPHDGFTVALPDGHGGYEYQVLYNAHDVSPRRIRWTLAHEIGHIQLGHARANKHDTEANREAQYFAKQLLMPLAVIDHYPHVARHIASICRVSEEAAGYRLEDLARHLAYKDTYGLTDHDRQFLRQFGKPEA